MGSIRTALAITAGLSLLGCTAADSGPGDSGSMASSPGSGVVGDKAMIEESLSHMDDSDRDVAMSKMQGLIDAGLYDPENENPLQLGEPAPDFELMPLRFYDFAIDQGIDRSNAGMLFEPVRLSSFRGSLPVVLIFGSYT